MESIIITLIICGTVLLVVGCAGFIAWWNGTDGDLLRRAKNRARAEEFIEKNRAKQLSKGQH